MRLRYRLLVWMMTATAGGCMGRVPSPERLAVDHVECARCRMLISTEAGSGQIVNSDADTRFYDDVGCLAADWAGHLRGDHPFVRLATGEWIDAAVAVYARPAAARTSMGSGLVAFRSQADAAVAGTPPVRFADLVHGADQ
jgi:nitrous oxide reductase accessory protein NosL